MLSIPTLTTERLRLRAFHDADLDAYAQICSDPDVMRFLGTGQTLSRVDAWRQMALFLGHWQLKGFGLWAVEETSSGRLIGRTGFFHPEGWPGFELGWTLGRTWWRKGYATEMATAALRYAFDVMQRDHVISLIHPDNAASIRVAERLGERPEGETEIFDHPVLVYGIERKR